MSKKYHVERREFLNKFKDMRAYVIGVVENTHDRHVCCSDKAERSHITLKIADCSEEIDLWFDLRTKEERENSIYKIRILAEVISEVRDAIELEAKMIEERSVLQVNAKAASTIH